MSDKDPWPIEYPLATKDLRAVLICGGTCLIVLVILVIATDLWLMILFVAPLVPLYWFTWKGYQAAVHGWLLIGHGRLEFRKSDALVSSIPLAKITRAYVDNHNPYTRKFVFEASNGERLGTIPYPPADPNSPELAKLIAIHLPPGVEIQLETPGNSEPRIKSAIYGLFGLALGAGSLWLCWVGLQYHQDPSPIEKMLSRVAIFLALLGFAILGFGFVKAWDAISWRANKVEKRYSEFAPAETSSLLAALQLQAVKPGLNRDGGTFQYSDKAKEFDFRKTALASWIGTGLMVSFIVGGLAPRTIELWNEHVRVNAQILVGIALFTVISFPAYVASCLRNLKATEPGLNDEIVLSGGNIWVVRDGVRQEAIIDTPPKRNPRGASSGFNTNRVCLDVAGEIRYYDPASMFQV